MKTNSMKRLGWKTVLASMAAGLGVSAGAQVAPPSGLPAPMTDSSSGAIINQVPPTRRIADPVPVRPASPTAPVAPAPVVPPAAVNPAAGVVPNPPGATGPVLRPEIGRSNLDNLQTMPQSGAPGSPANRTPGALSPADAAQRQLMIERENRMRGMNSR